MRPLMKGAAAPPHQNRRETAVWMPLYIAVLPPNFAPSGFPTSLHRLHNTLLVRTGAGDDNS